MEQKVLLIVVAFVASIAVASPTIAKDKANDLMAWTVTKDTIVQREPVSSERIQPPPVRPEYMKAKRSGEAEYSDFISAGKWEGYKPAPMPQ